MRIIFSRKGFDSAAGKAPSPILDGRPLSLPIPTTRRSTTTYDLLGLGDTVEEVTRGRITRSNLCHHDPMFENGKCAFGQTGAAQTHLAKQGVSVGDVFLFFGLFSSTNKKEKHHRIFGYLIIDEIILLGSQPSKPDRLAAFSRSHPHTIGEWNANNTLYLGEGNESKIASSSLRLTQTDGPTSTWKIPKWLFETGLSYHGNKERWQGPDRLHIVARGQEFVANIESNCAAKNWLSKIIEIINHG